MLIDSHCHLKHEKYSKTQAVLVDEAKAEGVTKLIDIGTSIKDNLVCMKNAEEFDGVYATVAIYPHENMSMQVPDLMAELRKQATASKKIVAIGECGIDISNWQGGRPKEEQIILFEEQIKLAVELNLPLIIHNRGGDEIILKLLQKYQGQGLRGVSHCFVSTWEFAQELLKLNFLLSFACSITYPSNRNLLETIKQVPDDKFLVETDAPYLPPQSMRGTVNEPKNVVYAARKIAEVKGISFEKACELSYSNTCKLFGIN
ncbi:hypothetical protein A2415_04145 [candidate division WWE3 bacterium RIFOXYC1_FULL_39_7]|uniref:Hydrolase TatD n=1 Tax=candidate division WWE3 bacterium RIFOXYC1_FULL_39_7 TaxID=1802643 RepID=A0A1F4WHR3_UNCKA|nr:MAG: hypothetical protein A2415_04145 [candidate division WWE3 bacterium RIFOXYC1_FULL_39_7]